MSDKTMREDLLKTLKHEALPTLGRTEPISLALTSAIAASHLDDDVERIEAKVSTSLMKKRQTEQGFLADDLSTQIFVRTTTAFDARVEGLCYRQ